MNCIYHILPANKLHLTPHIIKSIICNSSVCQHVFIIWQCGILDKKIYLSLKEHYSACIIFADTFYDLKQIIPKKNSPVLLHSIILRCCVFLFLNRFKNSSLIFWGSGLCISNIKQVFLAPLKRILFSFFKYKITLMEPDKVSLEKLFKQKNVEVIPYLGERENAVKDYMSKSKSNKGYRSSYPLIYIGNNTSCMYDYFNVVRSNLYNFRETCHILFMMNYDLKEDKIFNDLIEFCSDNYTFWCLDKTLYSISDYVEYIDKCSIYICGTNRQTGLGAIYTCLRLGKKIFLTGKNYQWIKSLGCHIFKVEDIETMSYDEFISPLSDKEIRHNCSVIEEFEKLTDKVTKWESLYYRMLNY